MIVIPVPCLSDNYAYIVSADGSDTALVVDPSEAGPVLAALEQRRLKLAAILNTHHHHDHVGGNEDVVKKTGVAAVCGHASDRGRIPAQTRFLEHGETLELGGIRLHVIHNPGHTRGAVSYVAEDADGSAVFTGDTLFASGCGRLFEGTAKQMYESLNVKLGALPDGTRVYCGHEYTANNLRFAAAIEPGNAAVKAKAARVAELRARGEPTVPSTMRDERATNPFMRCTSPEIIRNVEDRMAGGSPSDPAAVLGAIRAAKDAF
jgi:hydroxyacylglutathione hydrolase